MWLSLVLTYAGFIVITVSNIYVLVLIKNGDIFSNSSNTLLLIAAVDDLHQVIFCAFFTIIFFCALSRIELLIDVLPDLVKNTEEFKRHKLVWGAIFVNTFVHTFVSCLAVVLYNNDTPSPVIETFTSIIFMAQEVIFFLTFCFQIKILYDFTECRLSKVTKEDVILKEESNLIVFL